MRKLALQLVLGILALLAMLALPLAYWYGYEYGYQQGRSEEYQAAHISDIRCGGEDLRMRRELEKALLGDCMARGGTSETCQTRNERPHYPGGTFDDIKKQNPRLARRIESRSKPPIDRSTEQ